MTLFSPSLAHEFPNLDLWWAFRDAPCNAHRPVVPPPAWQLFAKPFLATPRAAFSSLSNLSVTPLSPSPHLEHDLFGLSLPSSVSLTFWFISYGIVGRHVVACRARNTCKGFVSRIGRKTLLQRYCARFSSRLTLCTRPLFSDTSYLILFLLTSWRTTAWKKISSLICKRSPRRGCSVCRSIHKQ